MYTLTVPQAKIHTLATDGTPIEVNFFWTQLKTILDSTLRITEGLAIIDLVDDVYKPIKAQIEVEAETLVMQKDKDFERLKEIATKYDPKKFGAQWLTNDPATDVTNFLKAFKDAVKSNG